MFYTDASAAPTDQEVMEDAAAGDTPGGFLCIPGTIAKASSCAFRCFHGSLQGDSEFKGNIQHASAQPSIAFPVHEMCTCAL